MSTPDTTEVDGPVTTPESDPTPPVETTPDPTSSAFWTSPSSYITVATYVLPILSTILHKDFSQYAQAISQLAPLVATAVLLVMRGQHKKAVIAANAAVQVAKVHAVADAAAHRRQLKHDAKMKALDLASVAEKKAFVSTQLAA